MSDLSQEAIDSLLSDRGKYEDLLYRVESIRDNLKEARDKLDTAIPKFGEVYTVNGKNMAKEKYDQVRSEINEEYNALVYTIIPAINNKIRSINNQMEW